MQTDKHRYARAIIKTIDYTKIKTFDDTAVYTTATILCAHIQALSHVNLPFAVTIHHMKNH